MKNRNNKKLLYNKKFFPFVYVMLHLKIISSSLTKSNRAPLPKSTTGMRKQEVKFLAS